MSTRNAVRRRELAVRDAEYVLQKTEKELNKEYMQAVIDCQTAYKKYLAAMAQLNFAEEAERQVRERYELESNGPANGRQNWQNAHLLPFPAFVINGVRIVPIGDIVNG